MMFLEKKLHKVSGILAHLWGDFGFNSRVAAYGGVCICRDRVQMDFMRNG